MLPSEMIILMAIGINRKTGKKLLTRPMDFTSEYVAYLYHSLVKRGYLQMHSSSNYQLTTLGMKALSSFLRKNKPASEDIVKKLQVLGIQTGPA